MWPLSDSLPKLLPPKIEEGVSLVLREFLSALQEGTSASGCKWLGGDTTSAGRKGIAHVKQERELCLADQPRETCALGATEFPLGAGCLMAGYAE